MRPSTPLSVAVVLATTLLAVIDRVAYLCTTDNNQFTVKVDLYAGEL